MRIGTHEFEKGRQKASVEYYTCKNCGLEIFEMGPSVWITSSDWEKDNCTAIWVTSSGWEPNTTPVSKIKDLSCNDIIIMGIIK